jgi:hypothetical protein
MPVYVSAAANKSIDNIHPVLVLILADAAIRISHAQAAYVDGRGCGLHDMSTVSLGLDAKGHTLACCCCKLSCVPVSFQKHFLAAACAAEADEAKEKTVQERTRERRLHWKLALTSSLSLRNGPTNTTPRPAASAAESPPFPVCARYHFPTAAGPSTQYNVAFFQGPKLGVLEANVAVRCNRSSSKCVSGA